MHWTDEGLVLGARRHGESSVILELMTREHGRHLGLVHGGRSRRMQPVLQPGNVVEASWRARIDEQLGSMTAEPLRERAARLMNSALALSGLAALTALLRVLPERDPHPGLFAAAEVVVDALDDPRRAPILFVGFELALLADLGFGLDLSCCAVTGTRDDLAFVSPRSGRAVSTAAGEPYRDRLLRLPRFLVDEGVEADVQGAELDAAFTLTGYFLTEHVFGRDRGQPQERARFVARATELAG